MESKQTADQPEKKSSSMTLSGVFPTLVMLILVLIVCSVLVIQQWPQPITQKTAGFSQPLQGPAGVELASFHLPAEYGVVYEQLQGIFLLSSTNTHELATPGYIYNRAVTPILTSTHELIYSGKGIWITNLISGHPRRLATLPSGQVITSLALSADGKTLAWSSAPKVGIGTVAIYVGQLDAPTHIVRVYQHDATQCPCFRVFSFLHASATTLLLTNDQGDHRLVQYGLWFFDLAGGSDAQPQPLLSSDVQQGPLLLAPQTDTLLYSSYEGFVPMPDGNVPTDITSLNYANSLVVASINHTQNGLARQHVLLSEQQAVSGRAAYRWVATPQFSPDERTLAYVEFSSDDRLPFARHYAVYSIAPDNMSKDNPQLLATASAQYIELGPWLTTHILTFYADNALYAFDVPHAALTTLAQTGTYARIIAVIG